MTNQVKYTLQTTIRRVIYLVVMCLVVILLWKLADAYKSDFVIEYGPIETAQSVLCLLIATSFALQAVWNREQRPLLLFLASLGLTALIREQDKWFEIHLPAVSWYFCWIFPAAAIINLCVKRAGNSILQFLQSGSFNMMFTAMVIIIPVAQMLGHRSFLADLLNTPRVDTIILRRLVEEPIELLGYMQILLASFEFLIEHIKSGKMVKNDLR